MNRHPSYRQALVVIIPGCKGLFFAEAHTKSVWETQKGQWLHEGSPNYTQAIKRAGEMEVKERETSYGYPHNIQRSVCLDWLPAWTRVKELRLNPESFEF